MNYTTFQFEIQNFTSNNCYLLKKFSKVSYQNTSFGNSKERQGIFRIELETKYKTMLNNQAARAFIA